MCVCLSLSFPTSLFCLIRFPVCLTFLVAQCTRHDCSSSVSSRRQPHRRHVTRHPESTSDNHGNGTAALGEISSKSLPDLQLPHGKPWNIIGFLKVTWCRCCSILLNRLFSLIIFITSCRHYTFCNNAPVCRDYLSARPRQWHKIIEMWWHMWNPWVEQIIAMLKLASMNLCENCF